MRSPPRLHGIDLSIRVAADEAYEARLRDLQLELLRLQTSMRDRRGGKRRCAALCVLFEGVDAAGKGGAIRRLTGRLDPRGYRVYGIGPPSDEELARHWLWRFATRMPGRGEIVIFDRSWYGRVLVERVEGLAKRVDWQRAYDEIAAFERMHVAAGVTLVKFWLHISKSEQLRRFRDRERDPFKEYKIGPDDWRNRKRWKAYVTAADAAFARTHAASRAWTLVSGEDKQHARLAVLQTVVRRLAAAQ